MLAKFTGILVLSAAFVLLVACTSPAQPPAAVAPTPTVQPSPTPQAAKASPASIAKGGKLYDKWWKVVQGAVEPKDNQALWAQQTTNTRTGPDTWRCKECHGWDYKGKDGAYGSGSHKTGFVGVFNAGSTKTKDQLVGILKGSTDPKHNFSTQLGEDGISSLADFLKEGLIDESKYIDYSAKKLIGADANRGKELYGKSCVACHGADGGTINFGSAEQPEFLGTIAKDNPWEFLHKVRFGQPGAAMPSAVESGLSTQDAVDIVAYSQSLKDK